MKSLIYKIVFAFLSVVSIAGCTRKDLDYEYDDPRINFVLPDKIHIELVQDSSTTESAAGQLILSNFKAAKGDVTVTRVGFCYSLEPNPTVETDRYFEDRHYIVLSDNGNKDHDQFFSYDPETGDIKGVYPFGTSNYTIDWVIDNLKPSQKYHCRTFIENMVGIVYGPDELLVQTTDTMTYTWRMGVEISQDFQPVIAPNAISLAVNYSFIEPATPSNFTEYGVCYSTSPSPTIDDLRVVGKKIANNQSVYTIDDLDVKTTYYVRPYFICEGNVVYGQPESYTTLHAEITTAITHTSSHLSDIDIKISLKSDNIKMSEIQEYGVCYSLEGEPTIDDSRVKGYGLIDGSSIREYSVAIRELESGVTLNIRPYVIAQNGNVTYGATKQKGTVYLEVIGSEQTDFEETETGFVVRGEVQSYKAPDGSTKPYPYRFTYRVDLEFKNIEDVEETGWESTYMVGAIERSSKVPTEELRSGIHHELMWHYSTVTESAVSMRAYAKMKDGTYITGKELNTCVLMSDFNKSALVGEVFMKSEKKE